MNDGRNDEPESDGWPRDMINGLNDEPESDGWPGNVDEDIREAGVAHFVVTQWDELRVDFSEIGALRSSV